MGPMAHAMEEVCRLGRPSIGTFPVIFFPRYGDFSFLFANFAT